MTKIRSIRIINTIIADKNQSQLSQNPLCPFLIPPFLLSTLTYFIDLWIIT